jgi:hypothetical protein
MSDSNHTTNTPQTKRCAKCGEEKPFDCFYGDKSGKYGLRSQCKDCHNESARHWQQANSEWKKEYDHRRYETNSERVKERAHRWRQDNPERASENNRRWYRANSERAKELSRRRQQANREQHNESSRRWCQANPERRRVYEQKRRARKRSLPATLTHEQWRLCLEHFNYCCAYCGSQRDFWFTVEQEHFIPTVSGGGYVAKNIIPACKSCNTSKQDDDAVSWLTERFGKRKAKEILKRIQDYFDSLA